jgi:hypothetical protein
MRNEEHRDWTATDTRYLLCQDDQSKGNETDQRAAQMVEMTNTHF